MINQKAQELAQLSIFQRVGGWMEEVFEGDAVEFAEDFAFAIGFGSALASVKVLPWTDGDTIIHITSILTEHSAMTGDLAFALIRENNDMVFGGFAIDEEGHIIFKHNLLGSTCDKDELQFAVLAVLSTADKYDDQIKSKWGGIRFADH